MRIPLCGASPRVLVLPSEALDDGTSEMSISRLRPAGSRHRRSYSPLGLSSCHVPGTIWRTGTVRVTGRLSMTSAS